MAKQGSLLPEAAEAAPEEVVRFINAQHFEERKITVADWKKVGVEGPEIVWDRSNSFEVPRDKFGFLNDGQFASFILADPRLEVVAVAV